MKTKDQKKAELAYELDQLGKSATVLLTDFGGVSTKSLEGLKKQLRESGTTYKVAKKRVLRIAFQEKGLALNPEEFAGQIGVVFSPKELIDIASTVYKFSKAEEKFKVVGGYDLAKGEVLSTDYIQKISTLPSKEVLLGQFVGMVAAPIKMFMLVLKERARVLESA